LLKNTYIKYVRYCKFYFAIPQNIWPRAFPFFKADCSYPVNGVTACGDLDLCWPLTEITKTDVSHLDKTRPKSPPPQKKFFSRLMIRAVSSCNISHTNTHTDKTLIKVNRLQPVNYCTALYFLCMRYVSQLEQNHKVVLNL
jgi:hypothetical protein